MKNRMLQLTKRGESTILGYVLLIVLAIGMAGAVYAYLKFQLPQQQPTCPQGVSISVAAMNCSQGSFQITLHNRGLFSVNGSYIKIGEQDRVYKELVNCPGPEQHAPLCQIYFNTGPSAYVPQPLQPGASWTASFPYTGVGPREVQIEPLVIVPDVPAERNQVLCNEAVISTVVQCT